MLLKFEQYRQKTEMPIQNVWVNPTEVSEVHEGELITTTTKEDWHGEEKESQVVRICRIATKGGNWFVVLDPNRTVGDQIAAAKSTARLQAEQETNTDGDENKQRADRLFRQLLEHAMAMGFPPNPMAGEEKI